MDSATLTRMVFGIIGGLGIFLLGMKNMSEGAQGVAGSGLRRMIGAVTDNRFMATAVGTIVTCIVQSSSITTVMVVGFVNSGLMQLSQAAGVIMGANIGTTITGWILVLDIGKYGLPMLGLAAFVHLFSRKDRVRYGAMALMGIGMVFFGLELMKDACAQIKDMPEFASWFHRFEADSFGGVLRCAAVGCLVTFVVQSSSATLGITISLANQGVISYPTAAALVIGENLGTTITAWLASLGTTTNARRSAYFHILFNSTGMLWALLLFPWYTEMVLWLVDADVTRAVVRNGLTEYPGTTVAIAATHTVFNIINTLLFLPLLPAAVRLLTWLVPAKAFKEKPRLTELHVRMLETPTLAIEQSRREILKMGDGCLKMLDWLKTLLTQEERNQELAERLERREQVLDTIQDEAAAFITNLLSGNVPHAVADEARRQLRVADEYESVSDYVANLLKFDGKLRKAGQRFTPKQQQDLLTLHQLASEYLNDVYQANAEENPGILLQMKGPRQRFRQETKRLRREHLDDLSSGTTAPQVSVAFMAALNAYSRVVDHAQNIAEAISDER